MVPDFLYLDVSSDALAKIQREGEVAGALRLEREEPEVGEGRSVVIVEARRAERQGVEFRAEGEGFVAGLIPLRYLVSLRHNFERQVSAGGVLVRGVGEAAEFALIRTKPREEVAREDELAEFRDGRSGRERRGGDRRRADEGPPGEERRREERRQRRRRRSGRWGPYGRLELPKGKLERDETPREAALREAREEMGVEGDLQVHTKLSTNHYVFRTPEGTSIFKTVHYFMLRTGDAELRFTPRREEGIVSVEWWSARRAIAQVAFRNLKPVLKRAWELMRREEARG